MLEPVWISRYAIPAKMPRAETQKDEGGSAQSAQPRSLVPTGLTSEDGEPEQDNIHHRANLAERGLGRLDQPWEQDGRHLLGGGRKGRCCVDKPSIGAVLLADWNERGGCRATTVGSVGDAGARSRVPRPEAKAEKKTEKESWEARRLKVELSQPCLGETAAQPRSNRQTHPLLERRPSGLSDAHTKGGARERHAWNGPTSKSSNRKACSFMRHTTALSRG